MSQSVLFLCSFGGAKSVIASTLFNRLAHERSLPFTSVAASVQEPYAEVPAPVRDYLQKDGVDLADFKPRRVQDEDIDGAARVVSIDCDLSELLIDAEMLERWDDVPLASEGVEASAEAIRRHVEALVKGLRDRRD